MIYVFLGDRIKTTDSVKKNTESLLKKKPDAEVFKINEDNFSQDFVLELLNSQGLFSKKYIVVLDNLLSKHIEIDEKDGFLPLMKNSEHIFFVIDDILSDSNIEVLKKISEKLTIFENKEVKKENFNIFDLANFLGRKDKKNLWVGYIKAIDNGVSVEEVLGILFWQVKNIVLVKKTKNQKETGLSPFVYKNAIAFSKNWEDGEILNLADKLIQVSDDVRSGEGEGEILLERVLLTI